MAFNFSAIFAAIIAEGPTLFKELEAEFKTIATGEGGAQKVANAAAGLGAIAQAVATGAAAMVATSLPPPVVAPPTTPPPAPAA